ncbi:hypothetical protein CPB86DRAFT_785428 [Serendipita vermifera]|nr:hypothetical protein CPB86DRAFT_785428 [Serendipita vermifera]
MRHCHCILAFIIFQACLSHIFAKYCTSYNPVQNSTLLSPPPGASWSEASLDKWAIDTNGEPLSQDSKEDIKENLEVTSDGHLLLEGFLQLYSLQTSNDEEETWKDLAKHGFDRNLKLKQENN